MFEKFFGKNSNSQDSSSQDLSFADEEQKQKKLMGGISSASSGGGKEEAVGYKFSNDKPSNIIAYCFGGEQNKDKLNEIVDNAEKIDDPKKRKEYIEKEIKDHGKKFDQGISAGMLNGFDQSQKLYEQKSKEGKINLPEPLTVESAGSKGYV